ncbi:tryptophan--tRNA ligase [Candidatus Saccharibacteria bacterium]|nr:tryptophan--tRNA ligase [Candidatus Saccharibacteria bacterium]
MKVRNINKRVVSGITSSNIPTIGNYLGAMVRWAQEQDEDKLYFIANSHAITVRQKADHLRNCSLDSYVWLIAGGLDPDKCIIFIQSMVPAHTELAWILNNYTTMGELNRMTQYKDKTARFGEAGQLAGLFDYPVLMAADILLYDADEVPTGEDQKQHIELTRNIAERFNNLHGEVFKLPKPGIDEVGARIMNIADPSKKMSKSDPGPGTVYLKDTSEEVITKFKKAVTDSGSEVKYDKAKKPAVSNLLEIYHGFSGKPIEEIENKYRGKGYGDFKKDLGELVAGKLEELQAKFNKIRSNESELMRIIESGNVKASKIANKKLEQIKQTIGLL